MTECCMPMPCHTNAIFPKNVQVMTCGWRSDDHRTKYLCGQKHGRCKFNISRPKNLTAGWFGRAGKICIKIYINVLDIMDQILMNSFFKM